MCMSWVACTWARMPKDIQARWDRIGTVQEGR